MELLLDPQLQVSFLLMIFTKRFSSYNLLLKYKYTICQLGTHLLGMNYRYGKDFLAEKRLVQNAVYIWFKI